MSGDVLVLLYIYFKSKSMGFGANSKKYKRKIERRVNFSDDVGCWLKGV
jgi:hypothetical protein